MKFSQWLENKNWLRSSEGKHVWLDDNRDPKDPEVKSMFGSTGDEIWATSAREAIELLKRGDVTSISLDYDLGGAGKGSDVAKWMAEQAEAGKLGIVQLQVHSGHPEGKKLVRQILQRAINAWLDQGLV